MIKRLIVGMILGFILLFPVEIYPGSLRAMEVIQSTLGPKDSVANITVRSGENYYIVKKSKDGSIWLYSAYRKLPPGSMKWIIIKAKIFTGGE